MTIKAAHVFITSITKDHFHKDIPASSSFWMTSMSIKNVASLGGFLCSMLLTPLDSSKISKSRPNASLSLPHDWIQVQPIMWLTLVSKNISVGSLQVFVGFTKSLSCWLTRTDDHILKRQTWFDDSPFQLFNFYIRKINHIERWTDRLENTKQILADMRKRNVHTCDTINPDGWDRAINLDWRRILFYIRANGSCREMNWLADMHERHWAQMAVLQSMRTGHRALAIIAIRRRAISLMRTHTGHTLDGHWTHIGHTPVPGVLIILNPASIDLS